MPTVQIDSARLNRELQELAAFTSVEPSPEGTAVTRIVFTADDLEARAWLKRLATEAGFTLRVDPVGNTFIRWQGTDPSLAAVATGSHIDAIPHAGMYDGTVGVLGGLEAMRSLKASGFEPLRSIELVLLTSEEPTRFGIGCIGSRLIAGVLDPARADALPDLLPKAEEGATLATVRAEAGFTGSLTEVRLAPGHYSAWVELHIEQGPLLERDNQPLGVVTSIAAPAGYIFTISGVGGHAGALLMPDRRDALCAAAEIILSVERHTLAANQASGTSDSVATVGACQVHPGNVNSVPSRVTLQLDIRDTDPARRERTMQSVRQDIAELTARRGVTVDERFVNADAPTTCSPAIIAAIDQACAAHNLPIRHMVSRAYHDSSFMAHIAPVAMIFIPCRNGVSHRPDEYATPESIALGTQILAESLAALAQQ
jgi:ureidoglycolate amidohydrolase